MAYTLPGSNTVTGPAQGPTGYNWTSPYSQWTDAQRQQASQFINPLLQSGDYAQIGRAAQQLGVNPFALNSAVTQTALTNPNAAGNDPGWGPAGMSGVGSLLRDYATATTGAVPAYSSRTPGSSGYTYNPTQSQNLKTFFGINSSSIPNWMSAQSYLNQQGYNPLYASYLVNKGNSADTTGSLQGATDFVNQRFTNEFNGNNPNKLGNAMMYGRGFNTFGNRWGGVGGLLGMPGQQRSTSPYPMTQYAPQTDWQSLAGLLSQQAFGR